MPAYLIFGITFAFAAAVQPGPLQAYLVSRTLAHGWRRALPAAFSPLLSDGPIIALALLVLSRVPAGFERGLHLAGGAFLLFLAWRAAGTWRRWTPETVVGAGSGRESLIGATVVNLLNPGPYLGWGLVMGPLLLKAWRESPLHGVALLAAFYATLVASMVVVVLLFAGAGRLGPRVNRALIGVSALALAAFGVWQLWLGVKAP
ncbi:MAG TPA: LysE family transporter [Thermoanaerobaculia bacterium]|nr:LysE family transporter [Thermoanaerobaculia bacterium]